MKLKLIYSFTVFLLFNQCIYAYAQPSQFQNLTALSLEAENFLKNKDFSSPYPAQIEIKRISEKIKLKKCISPITFDFANKRKKTGHTLLKASCSSPVNWRINLPVKITVFQDVLVLKQPVIRSQTIDNDDIIVKKMNVSQLTKGYYTHINQLNQLETKRNLKALTVLSPSHLKAKRLIQSGQQVTLQLNYSGIGVKASGTALQSASKGQRIKVRNNSSLKIIEGIVTSNSIVQVNL